MKVLLVATRSPHGRQTGRKTVLATIVASLRSLGHEVRVVAITDEAVEPHDAALEVVPPPAPSRIAVSVLTGVPLLRRSFNECLYASPTVNRRIRAICDDWGADLVIADMIRTAPAALATGRPVIVDLDDLLSRRYRELADGRADPATILGYYGASLHPLVRQALGRFAAAALRVESALLKYRERRVARAAVMVSLVSNDEARRFSEDLGLPVAWLPMAVPVPDEGASVADNGPDRLVFVGGLDYHANLEAIRWYVREVVPALASRGLGHLRLRIVGHCPPEVHDELGAEAVDLLGYVDDLAAELASSRAFVAPILPGTGLKTKVLEAMAAGLPVVTTPHGVSGLDATPGVDFLLASDGPAFAEAIERLVTDAHHAAAVGTAGRETVRRQFAGDVVTAKWRAVLEQVLPQDGTGR